jgi:hypothetical protein
MEVAKLNKLAMYEAVNAVLQKPEYQALWSGTPAFVKFMTEFGVELGIINQNSTRSGRRKTGVAGDKDVARKAMCKKANQVAGGIASYAFRVGNHELLTRTETNMAILLRGRGKDSRDKCSDILAAGTANLLVLADFNLTQEDLTELKKLIDAYDALAPRPQLVKGQIKGAGQAIDIAFDKADGILNNGLDKLMLAYEDKQPEFFRDYLNARVIIDRPASHTNGNGEQTAAAGTLTAAATTK